MTSQSLLDLWREAIEVVVTLAAPFLVTALVVGLVVAIFQTATQLQESILGFVPKLAAALVVMLLAGHWALDRLNKFTTTAFTMHGDGKSTVVPPPR